MAARPRTKGLRWADVASLIVTLGLGGAAALVFLVAARHFDAGRPDFFYLADAFLHGRTWLGAQPGPWDVIVVGARVYVPFAPFPALALVPLVAAVGPAQAATWQPVVNAAIAGTDVALTWVLAGRIGVRRPADRLWLALLLGFSTQLLWVAVRGGVWHTGQLVAVLLVLAALVETWGRRRPLLLGLLVGAAFLSRAPLALSAPFFAWMLIDARGVGGTARRLVNVPRWPWRELAAYGLGIAPAVAFFLWYNAVRFGSPLDSGYAAATLPDWLAALRAKGLFSPVHLPMNIDYLFLRLPSLIPAFPWLKPDGLGLSILVTSPGLLLALRADWRRARAVAHALTATAVLLPSLLYYGGGWLQFGYRYALDAIPFVVALCAMAAARHGIGRIWQMALGVGLLVGATSVYWVYHL